MLRSFGAVLALALLTASVATAVEPDSRGNWPRFRGPMGTGVSSEVNLPTKWASDTIAWKADLPVEGHSSPTIWGERVFLTGSSNQGGQTLRHVFCLDRTSGKLLWNKVAAKGEGEATHKMNSLATASCTTDGELVAAFFGPGGLHCFDMDGKPLWSRELGDFPGRWGVGASPIIVGDLVIQNCDCAGDSYLLAVNKQTGKDVWKTPRKAKPRGGWSTPVLIEHGGRRELLLNGEFGVHSYDPATGKPLWFCKNSNGRGTPSPAWGNGMAYVVIGRLATCTLFARAGPATSARRIRRGRRCDPAGATSPHPC